MGVVQLRVLHCKSLPKVQKLGVQDPYVIARYAGQEYRSRTSQNGGTDPVWNQTFLLEPAEGQTVVEITILNDRGRKDDTIGTARVDFSPVLSSGNYETKFPVLDSSGREHGDIYILLKYEVPASGGGAHPVAVAAAAAEMASVAVKEEKITYEQALSDARAKYYADVATAMVPHNAVTGALAAHMVEGLKDVKEEEEKEMEKIFTESSEKMKTLAEEAVKEWANIGNEFREDVLDTLVKHDPAAKDRFGSQLNALSEEMKETGAKARGTFEEANNELASGMEALLQKYKELLSAAVESYEGGFNTALGRYKTNVEEVLREEAETKSKSDASKFGAPEEHHATPAPPPPQSQDSSSSYYAAPIAAAAAVGIAAGAVAHAASAPPAQESHAPPPVAAAPAAVQYSAPPPPPPAAQAPTPQEYSGPPPQQAPQQYSAPPPQEAPQQYSAPPPQQAAYQYPSAPPAQGQYAYAPAPSPAPAAAAAAAGAVAGAAVYSNTNAEYERAEAERARQQAYYAQMNAQRAQYEAEMQRQQAAQAQAKMQAALYAQQRRRRVRRNVVGGIVLAKMID